MNNGNIFIVLGASNHTDKEREQNDFYATEPKAAELLCDMFPFHKNVWECACGQGHLAEVFKRLGHIVKATDLIDRGYGHGGVDFLLQTDPFDGDIITNPPYKYAQAFIEKALSLVPDGNYVAMLARLLFLEGKRRKELFTENPPLCVCVSSSRILCAKNAEFQKMKDGGGSATAFAWFVWRKGYTGDTTIRWFN